MMDSSMMNDWGWSVMGGFGLVMILLVILLVLGIVALLKYLAAGSRS